MQDEFRQIHANAQVADTLPRELRLTAKLGAPLALGELGWMSTYIVDALMIGHLPHSALSISASSLGNTIYYAIAFCVIHLMTGLGTLVAQSYGRGNTEDCTRTLLQSMWIVILGTPFVIFTTLAAIPLLSRFGVPADIIAETSRYLHALVWSTGPLLLYWALRRYLQSIDRVVLVMVSLLSASVVNLIGDWAFLYGHLGIHPMGIAGSGWATCIVRVYMLVLLLAGVTLNSSKIGLRFKPAMLRPDFSRLRALFGIGWAAALESLTDLGVSTFMSILCARLGSTLLAAHQVVLDLDAFIYMVPAGLAYATVVRVGQSAGRNSLPQVRRSAYASLVLAVGFISMAALAFTGFRHFWAGLYTNDPAVVAAAAPIFLICGILQIGDAVGAILSYALYGLGDTRTTLVVNTFWYWVIGMPLSYWLTFDDGLGLRGLWIGRAVAAIGSSTMMVILWRLRLRRLEGASSSRRFALFTPVHAKGASLST